MTTKTGSTEPPVSHEHHFVPRFVLRPWTRSGNLRGHYWDDSQDEVRVRKLGVGAFCKEIDLLSLSASGLRPDALERDFFRQIDDRGAKVRHALLEDANSLDSDQRSDFARLLLSLDARRPPNVAKLRNEGATHLRGSVNDDPEVIAAMKEHGIDKLPSAFFEDATGQSLQDRALLMMQDLVNNEEVGRRLINAHWRVYHLNEQDGSFVLGDRPLIRTGGYRDPECVWALPLSPRAVFVAANSKAVIGNFDRAKPKVLRKRVNESTMNQIDRYVFMPDESNLALVSKRLSKG